MDYLYQSALSQQEKHVTPRGTTDRSGIKVLAFRVLG